MLNLNPADAGWYAPLPRRKTGTVVQSLTPSAVWGSWGDPPRSETGRRADTARTIRRLRAAGLRGLAILVRDVAHGDVASNVALQVEREAAGLNPGHYNVYMTPSELAENIRQFGVGRGETLVKYV